MSRGQPGLAGLQEPCRCHDAGLAFAFAYHHQAHHVELNVPQPQPPPLQQEEDVAVEVAMNRLPVWDAEPETRAVPANRPRGPLEVVDGIHQPGPQDDADVDMEDLFY